MKIVSTCRFCGSSKLEKYLDLGEIPLVNNLLDTQEQAHGCYPLRVFLCQECTMSQLDCVIDPEILYSHYRYCSGMSNTFKAHCKSLANEIEKTVNKKSLVIDIAANDGTMLSQFGKTVQILGVEPAVNLCLKMKEQGIPYCNKFFGYNTALEILNTHGKADVIIAQNVFAHVDEISKFMTGIENLLSKSGTFIVEVPWVGAMIQDNLFSQTYHEHLSYVSMVGMSTFVKKFGLFVNKILYFGNIHGGTTRYYIKKGNFMKNWGETEKFLNYNKIQNKVNEIKSKMLSIVEKYGKISAVGAAAKGCILVNVLKLSKYIDKIYDSTPEKIGKFQPGSRLPIVDFAEIKNCKNPILILPDNLKDEIIKNVRKLNPTAKFIVALPEVQEI